jgi:hypothetical protein
MPRLSATIRITERRPVSKPGSSLQAFVTAQMLSGLLISDVAVVEAVRQAHPELLPTADADDAL